MLSFLENGWVSNCQLQLKKTYVCCPFFGWSLSIFSFSSTRFRPSSRLFVLFVPISWQQFGQHAEANCHLWTNPFVGLRKLRGRSLWGLVEVSPHAQIFQEIWFLRPTLNLTTLDKTWLELVWIIVLLQNNVKSDMWFLFAPVSFFSTAADSYLFWTVSNRQPGLMLFSISQEEPMRVFEGSDKFPVVRSIPDALSIGTASETALALNWDLSLATCEPSSLCHGSRLSGSTSLRSVVAFSDVSSDSNDRRISHLTTNWGTHPDVQRNVARQLLQLSGQQDLRHYFS